jgi:uncharacterized protein YidB (DUF937 family)
MGLMDILNGMQNGPRGGAGRAGGGGMSPLTMALLGLLAYKAVKSFSGSSAGPANPAAGDPAPGRSASGAPAPGAGGLGLDEILRGGLGGQGSGAGGAGAGGWGGLLTSGLGDLLDQFHGAGKGDAARSWVGSGQNEPIAPHELSQVLTSEQIDFLTQRTGLSREDLLAGLSEQLPGVVDGLTPAGRLPTSEEMNRAV